MIARAFLLVLLAALVLLPPLTNPQATGVFAVLRDIAIVIYDNAVMVGGAAFVALLLVRAARLRNETTRDGKESPPPVVAIDDAISSANGGNGLASRQQELNLNWGFIGWIEVPQPGGECVVIDGSRVIRETTWYIAPLKLVGRRSYMRRVRLAPKPLVIPTTEALSRDGWSVRIDARVIYTVHDPPRVLSEKPLEELTHSIQGTIAEHIRAQSLRELVGDQGTARSTLQQKILQSRALGGFQLTQVAIVNIASDERLIEIERETQIEHARIPLIEVRGEGKLLEARYNLQIEEWRALLTDRIAALVHGREMEKLRVTIESGNLQTIFQALAQVSVAGMSPAGLLDVVEKMMNQKALPYMNNAPSDGSPESLLQIERRLLEQNYRDLGITRYELEPNRDRPMLPGKVSFFFPEYGVQALCGADHPHSAPKVRVASADKLRFDLSVPWSPESHLIEVAVSAAMQAPFKLQVLRGR